MPSKNNRTHNTARFSIIMALLFNCCIFNIGLGQDNTMLLQQAADAYSNKNFQAAIDAYEKILENGSEAFEVYYNLGNAYYKSDQIAPAILNYERAKLLRPADEDLSHNLAMAEARTVDRIEGIPVPELITGYKSFVNTVSADLWGFYSIICFILVLGAVAGFLFLTQRWIKQLLLGLGVLCLVLSLLFWFLGAQQQSWLNNQKEAIIFQASVTASSTPNENGEDLFVLHAGTKVKVVKRFRDWVQVQIANGNTGWMQANAIQQI